jgi:hypothetical protein
MRRNLLAHGILPNAPYFLLALPDHFYLWKDARPPLDGEKPDYEIDSAAILEPYFEKIGFDMQQLNEQLNGASFELLLTSWLWELVRGTDLVDTYLASEANNWLVESGLLEAIRQGNIVSEPVR